MKLGCVKKYSGTIYLLACCPEGTTLWLKWTVVLSARRGEGLFIGDLVKDWSCLDGDLLYGSIFVSDLCLPGKDCRRGRSTVCLCWFRLPTLALCWGAHDLSRLGEGDGGPLRYLSEIAELLKLCSLRYLSGIAEVLKLCSWRGR